MAIALKNWHSTGKLNINSNEVIKLSRNTSWSEISSTDKIKERLKYQPVRIRQLPDSKQIYQSARKREPERLRVPSKDKRVELISSNNVKEKSQQKNLMKMNFHDKSIQSNSKSNNKEISFNVNKGNRKIRRNLNLNFVSPTKQIEKNNSIALPEVQKNSKSICSNSKNYRYRKSFLLPPNFIKSKYLKEQCSKVIPSSTTMKNDTITNLNVSEVSKNLYIKNSNVKICSSIQNTHNNSQMEENLKSQKRLQYNCKSKRNTLHKSIDNEIPLFCDESEFIRKNITSTDNKIQKQEQCNINSSNFSMNKSTDNLQKISNELNNIILTKGSEVSVNNDITGFSKKDYLCVDRNTIVSLKSTLEDMLKVFQDNALKIDLLLKHINKLFHVNTDSIEEQVHTVDSNNEMIKKTSELNLEEKITEDNNIDTVSSSKKNNIKIEMEKPVELKEEEKENISENLELPSNHTNIDHTKSLQLTPQVLQITIPTYTKVGESALQDYINLKASLNFLETPLGKKIQPRIQTNKNVVPNIPKDKSYLSSKIFTELQNLHGE
ncbi:PREDICTED: rhoGEF domain-containing protein gxcJ-like [Polistes dominula]|uniref:RhoGEF domain-containing protein gxcJ-like n=1 Tax=Polistes dominula TaxID=743375 RepID=A0ABM1HW02_POLDO|nr:PREDICTED: rhoGEF domain-containing protein gxcJ-like [Polistes dominula]